MNRIKNERIKSEPYKKWTYKLWIIKNEHIKNKRIKNKIIKKRTDPSFSLDDNSVFLQEYFIWDDSATFHLRRLCNISFYQLHGIRTKMVVTVWTCYDRLFLEQHETHSNIFQLIQNNTYITQIKHINSLCSGSSSLRVHKQLIISGYPNSSEPNSSEHSKSWSAPRHLVYWL